MPLCRVRCLHVQAQPDRNIFFTKRRNGEIRIDPKEKECHVDGCIRGEVKPGGYWEGDGPVWVSTGRRVRYDLQIAGSRCRWPVSGFLAYSRCRSYLDLEAFDRRYGYGFWSIWHGQGACPHEDQTEQAGRQRPITRAVPQLHECTSVPRTHVTWPLDPIPDSMGKSIISCTITTERRLLHGLYQLTTRCQRLQQLTIRVVEACLSYYHHIPDIKRSPITR